MSLGVQYQLAQHPEVTIATDQHRAADWKVRAFNRQGPRGQLDRQRCSRTHCRRRRVTGSQQCGPLDGFQPERVRQPAHRLAVRILTRASLEVGDATPAEARACGERFLRQTRRRARAAEQCSKLA